jgi:hypothetical protein
MLKRSSCWRFNNSAGEAEQCWVWLSSYYVQGQHLTLKGFWTQAQSSEREENTDHNCGLKLIAGEKLYGCKHQKCEHKVR